MSPKGEAVFTLESVDTSKTIGLNAHSLQAFRDKFPAYLDADEFSIDLEPYETSGYLQGLS